LGRHARPRLQAREAFKQIYLPNSVRSQGIGRENIEQGFRLERAGIGDDPLSGGDLSTMSLIKRCSNARLGIGM